MLTNGLLHEGVLPRLPPPPPEEQRQLLGLGREAGHEVGPVDLAIAAIYLSREEQKRWEVTRGRKIKEEVTQIHQGASSDHSLDEKKQLKV